MTLTPQQIKRRLEVIGGSEIAAVVGMHPYMGPIDVYSAKLEGQVVEDNHHMERGRFFERPTAEWRCHRYGGALVSVESLRSRRSKVVGCNPDFIVTTDNQTVTPESIDLSIKVPGPQTWHHWGESGTDEVPQYALLQLQWELIPLGELYGMNRGEVCAPIADDLRVYPVLADRELQAMLIEAAERFWRDHIEKRVPPDPDGTDSYSEYLARKFPRSNGNMLGASKKEADLALNYFETRRQRELLETEEKLLRQQLEAVIGEADGLEGDDFRITWRRQKGKTKTDWEAIARELGAPEDLIQKFTTIGAGFRRFLPTMKKEKSHAA